MKTLREIWNYREMVYSLVRKDLRGRYKGSVLGFLWTFLNPLLQLLVYNIVFSTILQSGIEKYYLYLFVALIPWIFFSSCLTGGASCVLNEKSLVTKIYFPREVLPIAFTTSSFVNMLLCFIVVIAVVLFSGVAINLLAWLFLPLIMLIEYILCLGITLIASAVTVYLRDLQHILNIVAMAWMYLTPIMYSGDMIPEQYQGLFNLNPMTPIVTAYRDILYHGRIPQVNTLSSATLFGVGGLLIGFFLFSKMKKGFAEEM